MLVYYERLWRYRREDQTLGPRVRHLDLLQGSQHSLHLGRVASLRENKKKKKKKMMTRHLRISDTDPESLADLDGDVLVLAGRLGGEHIGDLGVWRGLPADGAHDGAAPRAHAVLLHDDGDAAVAEAMAAGQHRPLKDQRQKLCFLLQIFSK